MKKQYSEILEKDLIGLVEDLNSRFCIEVPTDISTPEAMQEAGRMLGSLTNSYSYLMGVLSLLKASAREARKTDKELYESLVGKRDAVAAAVDMVKQEYSAVSRMITVKIEVNRELAMTDGR